MTQVNKKAISESLRQYVERYPSQNKASASLEGTSAGTISMILSGKWDNISDEMWRNIASQIGFMVREGWQVVETAAYRDMEFAMDDAQKWQNVTWVVGDAGCGKTTSARQYSQEHREVFYILCSEDMKRSDFIREIARQIGLRTDGCTLRGTLSLIIDHIVRMDRPLLLFDEADKLSERVFHYFIDLYNRLEDRCGIVFFSTNYIERRIRDGLRYNKCGYNEIHSRIGRKFFELDPTTAEDVRAICLANGLTDRKQVSDVIIDAQDYDFDLRRVKKAIHKQRRMAE